MPLADLEDDLLARHDVTAVAVDQDDPPKAVADEVLDQLDQQVEVCPGPADRVPAKSR